MKKSIVDFINYSPIESGLIFLIIAVTMFVLHLYKKKTVKFWTSSIMEWRYHINYIVIMTMSFIFGIILIIKSI
jgi:hypothetical protein